VNRAINHRLSRLEKQAEATAAVRTRRASEQVKRLSQAARGHAAMVGAIALYGDPQLDEPLKFARDRMLNCLTLTSVSPQGYPLLVHAIVVAKVPSDTENAKFTKVLHSAPQWLLTFCMCHIDAQILGLHLPTFPDPPPEPGLLGIDDMFRWPDLPNGTLGAGGPIPEPNRFEALSIDELIEFDMLIIKGEENWSRHDRRRRKEMMIKMIEHLPPAERAPFDRLLKYYGRSREAGR
jgi:hypothetical protein